MRGSGMMFVAGLVFTLCATASGVAYATENEPVTGGLLALPGEEAAASSLTAPGELPSPESSLEPAPVPVLEAAPTPPPPKAPAETRMEDDTSWGLLLRGGYFGLPDFIADDLFVQHPQISGSSFGAEIRYHGEGGGRGVESIGLAIDTATTRADGAWKQSETDKSVEAGGEFSVLAITLTGYWSIFPSWYVHPYFGLGIGVAHVKGHFEGEDERIDADVWVPAVHIPVGLAVELGKHFQLAVEGRFIDGIAIGGALQVRF